MSRILPTVLVFISGYANTENVFYCLNGLRHRKCFVRGYMRELFVSKTRTSEVRASEGFRHNQRVHITPYKALSMT